QYRRNARHQHPDKGGSHDQFTQLQAAKDYMEVRQSRDSGADDARRGLEQPKQ
ncbi:SLC16A12, partial [Symbiodinium pilosum]